MESKAKAFVNRIIEQETMRVRNSEHGCQINQVLRVFMLSHDYLLNDQELSHYQKYLLPDEWDRSLSIQDVMQKNHTILGKVLIRYALSELYPRTNPVRFHYNSFHRPNINNGWDFNLTHTKSMICVVTAFGCQVGIDAEYMQPDLDLEDFHDCFTAKEWRQIHTSKSERQAFFLLWTKKEALLKATGMGLQYQLNKLDVCQNTVRLGEQIWRLQRIDSDSDVIIHLGTNCLRKSTEIIKLKLEQIS
jgi:4'-phosphopantetheinyl transferase